MIEGEGDDQLSRSGCGAVVGCHCGVLWWREGRVTTNFGGVDVVPLQGANFCFTSSSFIFRATNFTQMPKKTTMNLASCRRCTLLYIDNTKIAFCYLGSMLV